METRDLARRLRAVPFAATLLAMCACGDQGVTVDGKALLRGASDSSGITVGYRCVTPNTDSCVVTTTAADGSYSLALDSGEVAVIQGNLLAQAPSTVEGQLQIDATGSAGHLTIPTVYFSPLGGIEGYARIGGAVTGNGGILVSVEGTQLSATTRDDGHFELSDVPVGPQTVAALLEGHPLATAAAAVPYADTVLMAAPIVLE